MLSKKIGILLVINLLSLTLNAQKQPMSLAEFLTVVKQYHPLSQQANIQIGMAEAELMASKGGFDPSVYTNYNQKDFGSKRYYNYSNTEVKIPTWYGIDFKAGVDRNGGVFQDEELSTGTSSFLGFQANLGKGLLMDKRRAAVLEAKRMINFSNEERKLIINDLFYDAAKAYFDWQNLYFQKELIDSVVKANEERFKFIKTAYQLGDRPAIDTTEALSQLQGFIFQGLELDQELTNARLALSVYLWTADRRGYLLGPNIVPEAISFSSADQLEAYLSLASNHPKLSQADIKVDVLNIQRKLKQQSLLPTVNVQYNLLDKNFGFVPGSIRNNQKFGINFGLPLLFREGRGELQMAKLKIDQQTWKNSQLNVDVQNKVRQTYNDNQQFLKQVAVYQDVVKNSDVLYKGEVTRFETGESSVFLVNSRENKLLESRQKLLSLRTKVAKSLVGIDYAAGVLWNRF